MIKPLLAMSALALAAPAFAQSTTPQPGATPDPVTQPTTTTTTSNQVNTIPPPEPQTTQPVEPTEDAATTATPSEANDVMTDADESEDSMTTTATESMSDATTTQTTDLDATATMADQTGVTTEATAATTAQAPAAAPAMAAGTAMGGPSNWAEFDADKDGNLTPLEFGKLAMDAKGQPVGADVDASLRSRDADLPAVQVLNSTSTDLARVDTDRNWMVSQAELQAYQPE